MTSHAVSLFPVLLAILSDNADEVVLQGLVVLAEIVNSSHSRGRVRVLLSIASPFWSIDSLFDRHEYQPNAVQKVPRQSVEALQRGQAVFRESRCIYHQVSITLSFVAFSQWFESMNFPDNCAFCWMPNSSSEHSLKSSQKNRPTWNSPQQWFAHWTRYCWRRPSCLSCEQSCGTSKMRYEYQSLVKSPTPIWMSFQKSASLFECLYKSWAHCPVSTMSLCLLAQCYQHVSDLVIQFANLEITVEFLTEMDKLVQLIESPIFACKFFKWNAPPESHKNQLQHFVWHSSPMITRNRSNSSKHYSES